jgi:hypothetical protein
MDLTGDNVLEFRSLSAQESAARARELRGRAGWIDLDVFASKTDRAAPAGGEEAMQISLPPLPGGRAPSLKEYQERLRSVNGLKVKARPKARSGLILHALEPREGGEIKQTKTPSPPQPLSPEGRGRKLRLTASAAPSAPRRTPPRRACRRRPCRSASPSP